MSEEALDFEMEEDEETLGPGDMLLPTYTQASAEALLLSGWTRFKNTRTFYWPASKTPRA